MSAGSIRSAKGVNEDISGYLGTCSHQRENGWASARELRRLQERSLTDTPWLVLVLDGKAFAEDALVIALGVTTSEEKRLLGLVQTATENKGVCADVLRELVERGFSPAGELLVVLDGAKGLRAAVHEVVGDRVVLE